MVESYGLKKKTYLEWLPGFRSNILIRPKLVILLVVHHSFKQQVYQSANLFRILCNSDGVVGGDLGVACLSQLFFSPPLLT